MTDQVDEQYVETTFLPVAPPQLSTLIARTDLTRRLDEAVKGTRLTVVVAPAGFGKDHPLVYLVGSQCDDDPPQSMALARSP